MATVQRTHPEAPDAWADLNARWFFAWRMAAACESALREVHSAMSQQRDAARMRALEMASQLLRRELVRWLRRGEALDIIVERIPREPVALDDPA